MRPLVLCGASGVGKGTLIKHLMDKYPTKFGFSVSHTTRAPRVGEVNGVHYHFETYDDLVSKNAFVEHAQVHLNFYGTSIESVKNVLSAQKCCILDIDIKGARQVKFNSDLKPVVIFIKAPNYQELEARLRGRKTDTEEQIQVRLKNGIEETELADKNEDGLFDEVVVNDDIDKTLATVTNLIQKHVKIDLE